jgi:CBS domain-containing protein
MQAHGTSSDFLKTLAVASCGIQCYLSGSPGFAMRERFFWFFHREVRWVGLWGCAGDRPRKGGLDMSLDNDDTERVLEEEHPGPHDLESALVTVTLSDVIQHKPLVVEANSTLAAVIEAMQREDRGTALVVEAGKLVGIFTERDVLMKVAGHAIDLTRSPVSTFMTRDPVTLPADSAVAFALNRMVVEGFRHIPLVDDDNRPVAEVSMRNLIEYLSDFYNRDVLNLPPDPQVKSSNREGA